MTERWREDRKRIQRGDLICVRCGYEETYETIVSRVDRHTGTIYADNGAWIPPDNILHIVKTWEELEKEVQPA